MARKILITVGCVLKANRCSKGKWKNLMDRQAALPRNGWRMMNEGRQDGRLIRKKPLIANIVLYQQFSDEQRKNETGHTSDSYGIIDSNWRMALHRHEILQLWWNYSFFLAATWKLTP